MDKEQLVGMDDDSLLRLMAETGIDFRNAVISGDTDWVYKRIETKASLLSRKLVDQQAEWLRRVAAVRER